MSDGEGCAVIGAIGGIAILLFIPYCFIDAGPGSRNKVAVHTKKSSVVNAPHVRYLGKEYDHKISYKLENLGGRTRHNLYKFQTPLKDTLFLLDKHDFRFRMDQDEHKPPRRGYDTAKQYTVAYRPLHNDRQMFTGVYGFNIKKTAKKQYSKKIDGVLIKAEKVVLKK